MKFGRYAEEFEKAVQISKAWDLEVDSSESRLLEPADLQRTAGLVEAFVAAVGWKAHSTNCGACHTTQRHVICEQDSELNPVITIGWLEVDERRLFQTSRRKLKREMKKHKKRQSRDPLDYHAWLTVRDGDAIQIIDCTIAYYLARKNFVPKSQATIWQFKTGNPPATHEWIEYRPLLAGQEVLEATGELKTDRFP